MKILLAHGGGMLPYQIGRLDRGFGANPATRVKLKDRPSEFLGSFYYDTVLFDDAALSLLASKVPHDHLLFGADYPFPIRDDEMVPGCTVSETSARHALTGILGGNVLRLIGGS